MYVNTQFATSSLYVYYFTCTGENEKQTKLTYYDYTKYSIQQNNLIDLQVDQAYTVEVFKTYHQQSSQDRFA